MLLTLDKKFLAEVRKTARDIKSIEQKTIALKTAIIAKGGIIK